MASKGANASLAPADTPGILQPLQELPLPARVSWTPQTVGWVGVAILLVIVLMGLAWALWRRHVKRRYRRVALAQLARLEADLQDPVQRVAALAAIAPLVKRASLAATPRERVAALTGDAWLAFLKRTHASFDESTGALLALVSYAPNERIAAVSQGEAAALVGAVRDWIEHHHVEV
ncbi:DUF4381 domain-containing protein [Paraburkholderia sp. DHOC27]|nr:DUF4381 domain-containing protein [Paraburkholderia sp. DHOC27]